MARKLVAMGHTVRIIPAPFVKPFVKSNKNDARDAEAIAEAVVRPTMRFVEIKTEDQVDLQALHRVRDRIVANRTQLICQMRAFCLEYGIPIRQGVGAFKLDIARIVADEGNNLTPMMRTILKELWNEFTVADARLAVITRKLEAVAERLDTARRLMSIPGIGPLSATALVAAVGDGRQFSKARDLAAWLGLVPRQNSTGGKTILLGISKRGNDEGLGVCVRRFPSRRRSDMGDDQWAAEMVTGDETNPVAVTRGGRIFDQSNIQILVVPNAPSIMKRAGDGAVLG